MADVSETVERLALCSTGEAARELRKDGRSLDQLRKDCHRLRAEIMPGRYSIGGPWGLNGPIYVVDHKASGICNPRSGDAAGDGLPWGFAYPEPAADAARLLNERAIAEDANLDRWIDGANPLSAPPPAEDTVAFVQQWMASGDHEPDQWHRDFAAAIDARCASPASGKAMRALYSIYNVLHCIYDKCEDEGDRIYLGSANDHHTLKRQLRRLEKLIPEEVLYPDMDGLAALASKPDEVTVPEGMKPWHGGWESPADYDGGELLMRNGQYRSGSKLPIVWRWNQDQTRPAQSDLDVIAYPPKPSPDRVTEGELAIEALAQFLHDEGGFGDAWPDRTWPEHPADTGQREGGWVKIVPTDVQAKFRDVARRWLSTATTDARLREENEALRALVVRARPNMPDFLDAWHADARAALGGEAKA